MATCTKTIISSCVNNLIIEFLRSILWPLLFNLTSSAYHHHLRSFNRLLTPPGPARICSAVIKKVHQRWVPDLSSSLMTPASGLAIQLPVTSATVDVFTQRTVMAAGFHLAARVRRQRAAEHLMSLLTTPAFVSDWVKQTGKLYSLFHFLDINEYWLCDHNNQPSCQSFLLWFWRPEC